jgi:hypothetical protein
VQQYVQVLPATIFGHVFNGPGTLIDTVASTTGGCDTARTITITTAPLLTTTLVQQYVQRLPGNDIRSCV